MKRVICTLLALVPLMAAAQSTSRDARSDPGFICFQKGEAYRLAAVYRDSSKSPEEALEGMQGLANAAGLQQSFIKKAINNVYFDGRFAAARGGIFRQQMTDLCLQEAGLKPRYQPLK